VSRKNYNQNQTRTPFNDLKILNRWIVMNESSNQARKQSIKQSSNQSVALSFPAAARLPRSKMNKQIRD
jgi:hypothetical protein